MTRLERFGVFVEIAPGKEGLVHQSELDLKSVRNVADKFAEGDLLDVMLLEIQDTGKLSLSRCEACSLITGSAFPCVGQSLLHIVPLMTLERDVGFKEALMINQRMFSILIAHCKGCTSAAVTSKCHVPPPPLFSPREWVLCPPYRHLHVSSK